MNLVEIESLHYAIGGHEILSGVSMTVERGDFVGIIGPNGGGKTTLLNIIMGVVGGWTGAVKVFGRDPRALGRERNLMAFLPQNGATATDFPATVLDAVLMGRIGRRGLVRRLGREDRDVALRMIDAVGMLEHADRPLGDLSGGQRQRVFIARALAGEPELLILDEPMVGVDRVAEEAFYKLLGRLKRDLGLTVLMASHDLTMVSSHCSKVACLNRRLHCHGTPDEIDHERLADLYGSDLELFLHGDIPHRVVKRHD